MGSPGKLGDERVVHHDPLGREVARGVPAYQGSCSEVYLEKAFDGLSCRPSSPLPVAKELGETSVMMLVHPTLTAAELEKSCAVLDEVLSLARN